eukprot:Nk52_evm3s242 gene=Nk52_evmTU3s242
MCEGKKGDIQDQEEVQKKEVCDEYTVEEVAKHDQPEDAWMIVDGCVYNVTQFLELHPGGADIMHSSLGKDCSELLRDPSEHAHSAMAFGMLDSYRIGTVAGATNIKMHKPVGDGGALDVDWSRGLLFQVGALGDKYENWVDDAFNIEPKMFDQWYLEIFSKTPWYTVALLFVPFTTIMSALSLFYGENPLSLWQYLLVFPLGILFWTITEYTIHRFAFHTMPGTSWILITLHFMFHGIHHKCPLDRYRLVMPPIISLTFAYCFYNLVRSLLPFNMSCAFVSGFAVGYMYYDLFHYFCHHAKFTNEYVRDMKSYHMAHHFQEPNAGFGVSNKLWDIVFGTTLENYKKVD